MKISQNIKWDIVTPLGLDKNKSYLICANHQSWVDIVVIQQVFNKRIPFVRFFLKQELLYVPFLGLAWWGLDFPFMKRYSKEYLELNPGKKNSDLETTRRACEKLRGHPVSILNFLEGTRFTNEKKQKQNSNYDHLLKPKAGGLAFVIGCMGEQFSDLLDVTIIYPQGPKSLWQLFSGQINHIMVHVRQTPIPKVFLNKNYAEDSQFKIEFQNWVHDLWSYKDAQIAATQIS